jgi:hypothetical protein
VALFGDSDLAVFFADFGQSTPVVWNGEPAVNGILDTQTDVFSHGGGPGGQERNTVVLRIPYNAFSAIPKPRDPITVAGVSYTVQSLPEQKDMQVTELYLKRAS